MLDHEKWIASQAVMKEVIAKCPNFEVEGSQALEEAWIQKRFFFCLQEMEAYATVQTPMPPPMNSPVLSGITHLSDERVAAQLPPPQPWSPAESLTQDKPLKNTVAGIAVITEKEYKPKKFRYGIKDSNGVWYSTFFKNHYLIAMEAKNKGKMARILYEVGEYNGKPQYTIQSIDL